MGLKELKVDQLSDASSTFLDLTRGISAQAVLFGHAISYLGILKFMQPPEFPWIQNIAVAVFFYLSGYLISYSTIRKNQKHDYPLKDYLIDRFARIYSTYLPAILFIALVDGVTLNLIGERYPYASAFNLKHFVGNLLMLQDFPVYFHKLTSFGSARPFWTLGIEWWFYLAFGWALLFPMRTKKEMFVKVFILIPLLIVPGYNILGRGVGLTFIWIAGAVSPVILSRIPAKKTLCAIIGVVLTVLATKYVLKTGTPKSYKFAFLMSASFSAWLWYFQTSRPNVPVYLRKFSQWIAGFSFTLYLVHYTILEFLIRLYGEQVSPFLMLALMVVLSNIVSIVFAKFTEEKHKAFGLWIRKRIPARFVAEGTVS